PLGKENTYASTTDKSVQKGQMDEEPTKLCLDRNLNYLMEPGSIIVKLPFYTAQTEQSVESL
ncbi:mCG146339, partial [Mus musculus]